MNINWQFIQFCSVSQYIMLCNPPLQKCLWSSSVQLNKIFSKRKRSAFSYDILNNHRSHHHNHQHSFKLSLISNLLKCSSQRIVCVFYPFDGQQVRGESETKQIKASTALTSYHFHQKYHHESWFIMIHHNSSWFIMIHDLQTLAPSPYHYRQQHHHQII